MATVTDIEAVEQEQFHPDDRPFKGRMRFDSAPASPTLDADDSSREGPHTLAMFCYEDPDSMIGRFALKTARALAEQHLQVHIFSDKRFETPGTNIRVHSVGSCDEGDLIGKVHEFTRRATNAFLRQFQQASGKVTLMAHEWSAIPTVSLLHGIKNVGAILSLHSTERQRGGVDTGESRWIEETELAGIREARAIIVHDAGTADVVRNCIPDSHDRIVDACSEIPMAGFRFDLDPGVVKSRFDVGPVDPTILYIGDLDERYGANLLMKAMPAVLKRDSQARCIFVGDGQLLWPLRVYSRYLLLDHAVRTVGHLGDRALYELIHAADVVVVPSIESTPWWPIEAAWVASRPVVATVEAAPALLEHEKNAVLVEPNETDLAEGILRVLADPGLGKRLASQGKDLLEERYREERVVSQIARAIEMEASVESLLTCAEA